MSPQPMAFQAYHGVSAAQHQAFFNKLSSEGYGMISLSVYGDPGNAPYAAVWVNRPMPGWVAVHGVNAAEYQNPVQHLKAASRATRPSW